jgi:hypothetical protein
VETRQQENTGNQHIRDIPQIPFVACTLELSTPGRTRTFLSTDIHHIATHQRSQQLSPGNVACRCSRVVAETCDRLPASHDRSYIRHNTVHMEQCVQDGFPSSVSISRWPSLPFGFRSTLSGILCERSKQRKIGGGVLSKLPLFRKCVLIVVAYRPVSNLLINPTGCRVRQVHEQRTELPA